MSAEVPRRSFSARLLFVVLAGERHRLCRYMSPLLRSGAGGNLDSNGGGVAEDGASRASHPAGTNGQTVLTHVKIRMPPKIKWQQKLKPLQAFGEEAHEYVRTWSQALRHWQSEFEELYPSRVRATTFANLFDDEEVAQRVAQLFFTSARLNKLNVVDSWQEVMRCDIEETIFVIKHLVNFDNEPYANQRQDTEKASLARLRELRMDPHVGLNMLSFLSYTAEFNERVDQFDIVVHVKLKRLMEAYVAGLCSPLQGRVAERLERGAMDVDDFKFQDEDAKVWDFDELQRQGLKRKFVQLDQLTMWAGFELQHMLQLAAQSETAGLYTLGVKRGADGAAIPVPAKRHKLDVAKLACRFFASGRCRAGNKCRFVHGTTPARPVAKGGSAAQNQPLPKSTGFERYRYRCFCCGCFHNKQDKEGNEYRHFGVDIKTGEITCPFYHAKGWKNGWAGGQNRQKLDIRGVTPLSVADLKKLKRIPLDQLRTKRQRNPVGAVQPGPGIKAYIDSRLDKRVNDVHSRVAQMEKLLGSGGD